MGGSLPRKHRFFFFLAGLPLGVGRSVLTSATLFGLWLLIALLVHSMWLKSKEIYASLPSESVRENRFRL